MNHRSMNRTNDYFKRQLAHCAEAIALCERTPTSQQLADAEAALAVSAPAPQAELKLRVA